MTDLPLDPPSVRPASLDIRQRHWIKRLLPNTMFGRSLLLIVMPLILVQAISAWVFYSRHWETVAHRFAADVAAEIGLVAESLKLADSDAQAMRVMRQAGGQTDVAYSFERGATLLPPVPPGGSGSEEHLRVAMEERVIAPYRIDGISDPGNIVVTMQLPQGVLTAALTNKRLSTSTTYIFILWMIGSSLFFFAVAAIFLRNQVKSLRRLAAAADGFGKGRPIAYAKVEGALEVRQAAVAFFQMRDRIQRQIRQRTEMLAGVSHDLRTPLTRMKLALAFMADSPTVAELKSDVVEMEHLVQLYLDFARGEGTEAPIETNIAMLLADIAAAVRREGTELSLDPPPDLVVPVRPNALRRCLGNLIANGARYGKHVWLTGRGTDDGVDILVDDDGPGIPASEREHVFQPFIRLDSSRNPRTGGIGLGLTIARDVARSHGGDVRLETSPHGGLRACIHLPR
ncbi:MAG: two-component sensor histidine kinase [Alphaproteobacteria bacterium]|nr:two-component sensor histidine kinase [Alphaproteobacteria bacterium]MBV9551397.1 two-component sensor histidine kinase [Alphaproteobacteria bacterium]